MSEYIPEFNEPISPLRAIANWVKRYREVAGLRAELSHFGPEDVAATARDIGVSLEELRFAVEKGPHAADELARLLKALGVDPDKLAHADPATMRNLQKVCLACEVKGHCRHELATGSAARNYRGYCPNAITLDQMFGPKSKMAKAPSKPSVAP